MGTVANTYNPRNIVKNLKREAGGLVGAGKMVVETVVGTAQLIADNPVGGLPSVDAMLRNAKRVEAITSFAKHPIDTIVKAHSESIARVEAHEAKGEYFLGGVESGQLASGDAAAVLGAAELGVGLARGVGRLGARLGAAGRVATTAQVGSEGAGALLKEGAGAAPAVEETVQANLTQESVGHAGIKAEAATTVRSAPAMPAPDGLSGPVAVKPPPNATAEELAQVREYCAQCNDALARGEFSDSGRVSTKGALRKEASAAAGRERLRAAEAGKPYQGHAGHVPDTTWTGKPDPPAWMDLTPRVNTSLGGQAGGYPLGFKPTEFVFTPLE